MQLFALVCVLLQCAYGFGFSLQPRIVNGVPSNPEDFPFLVRIIGGCNGNLISDRWVLSAGHCVHTGSLDAWTIVQVLVPADGSGQYFDIPPQNRFVYPEWSRDGAFVKHDIGLLMLPSPIKPHPFAAPARLPAICNEDLSYEKVIVAGNGMKSLNTRDANDGKLTQIQLEVLPQDICESKIEDYPAGTIICALPDNGRTPYHGDSGGPMIRERDGTLIGIVHGMTNDVEENERTGLPYPSITKYMKIDYYFNWISHVTGIPLPQCGPSLPKRSTHRQVYLRPHLSYD